MPKTYVNNTLGFTLSYNAPTLEEAVALIGKEAVENAVNSLYTYRSWNPAFYDALAEALVKETGVAIPDSGKTTSAKDENGSAVEIPIPVSTKVYLAKLLADSHITQERANQIAQEVSKSPALSTLDITTKARESKPSKEGLLKAAGIMERVTKGEITQEDWIAKFDSVNPQRPFATFGDWTQDNIARALKENSDRAARQANADL